MKAWYSNQALALILKFLLSLKREKNSKFDSNKGGGGKTVSSFASIFKGAVKKGGGVAKPSLDRKVYSTPNKSSNTIKRGNMEGNYTPTKRKLISDRNIQNLIGIFDNTIKSKPSTDSGESESPAKRGKWGPWGD